MADDPYAAFRVAPAAADPYAAFRVKPASGAASDASASSDPSWFDTAGDVVRSGITGIENTAIGAVTLPVTAASLLAKGLSKVTTPIHDHLFGARPPSDAPDPDINDYFGFDAAKQGIEAFAGPMYKPQTTPGRYAETIAEMVPAVLGGPGGLFMQGGREAIAAAPTLAGKAWEAVKPVLAGAVAPGLASEAAGEALENGPNAAYAPYARVAAGLVGAGVPAAIGSYASAPDRAMALSIPPEARAAAPAAQAFQNRAAAAGVPVSTAEAYQAVTNGGTKLADLQRVIEGSTAGGARMTSFYADRPARVEAAANRYFDTIAPAPDSAAAAGLAGKQAGENALLSVERQRTDATTPLYDAAGSVQLPPDAMRQLLADMDAASTADRTGVTSSEVNHLRTMLVDQPGRPGTPGTPASRTPVTGPDGRVIRYESTPATAGTPDRPMVPVTDIENANRARKAMRDRLSMPLAPGREPILAEQQHAVGPFMDRLTGLMEDASPEFRAANQAYGRISDDVVNPLRAGPVGTISKTDDLGAQGHALVPSRPAEGAPNDAATAVSMLAQHDPDAVATIVRNRLVQQFAESAKDNVGGPNQWGGAKFAAQIAGNPIQEDTLRAALGALPRAGSGANRVQQLDDLLNVFRATGQRKPQGSATTFNQQIADELGHQGVGAAAVQAAATGGLGLPALFGRIAEAGRQHALNRNSDRVAQVLTAPDGVSQIAELARRNAESPLVTLFRRQALQSPGEADDRQRRQNVRYE